MPTCAILTCKVTSANATLTKGGVSYHRFPKDPPVRKIWIEATGKVDWIPTKWSTICSKHFRENDFTVKASGNRYLKDGAIPSVNIVCLYSHSREGPLPANEIKLNTEEIKPEKQDLVEKTQNIDEMPCSSFSIKDTILSCEMTIPKKRLKIHTHDEDDVIVNKRAKLDEELITSTPKKVKSRRKLKIISCTNSPASTPRKQRLKKIISLKDTIITKQKKQIKRIQAQNRRLKKKVFKLEDIIQHLHEKFAMPHEDLDALKNTNLQVHDIIGRIFDKSKTLVTRKKYSPALRTFAMTLHYYSPKAYNYVRNAFNTCLPHERTLKKWYSSINGEPGFTSESFKALDHKVKSTKYGIIAGLVIDEMAIRQRVEWDGNRMHGYVNFGSGLEGDTLEAKEALVFLVTGINCNFKVPVAYFLVNGVTGTQRANLIKLCLEKIHETGIKIVSLTFDGCAANLSMVKNLGCDFENKKFTFAHPTTNQPVVAILDPSHMVKLIRNAFQMYKIFTDENGNKIEWAHLEALNNIQEKEGYHLANKLRQKHIQFQNQKMKVKLATQLFSLSVADALDCCREDMKIPAFVYSSATAHFLRTINNLFDIFNSRSVRQFGYKKALNKNNAVDIFDYLTQAIQYISTLKCDQGFLIKSPRKVGFLGFIGCAEAVKHFFKTLVESGELSYFPFYKVSQDHLELLFGNIRSHGGSNNNPTSRQFKAAYKKILVHVELKDFGNGNCTSLEDISILHCTSAIDRINHTTPSIERVLNDVEDDDDNDIETALFDYVESNYTEFSCQVISYIAGNIVHTLMKKIKCDICIGALLSKTTNESHKFILRKDKGGLIFPSSDVIKICRHAESIIRIETDLKKINKEFLIAKILRFFVGTTLFDDISFHQLNEYPESNHVSDLIKAVIQKYINIRLHYLLQKPSETKRQVYNKLILFKGQ